VASNSLCDFCKGVEIQNPDPAFILSCADELFAWPVSFSKSVAEVRGSGTIVCPLCQGECSSWTCRYTGTSQECANSSNEETRRRDVAVKSRLGEYCLGNDPVRHRQNMLHRHKFVTRAKDDGSFYKNQFACDNFAPDGLNKNEIHALLRISTSTSS
jgi:hypothetical protein